MPASKVHSSDLHSLSPLSFSQSPEPKPTSSGQSTPAKALSILLQKTAADGYSPDLVLHELKRWASFESEGGIGIDENAIEVFSVLPHPFPFTRAFTLSAVREALWAIDPAALKRDRTFVDVLYPQILSEGLTATRMKVSSIKALSRIGIGIIDTKSPFTIGRNRIERSRATYLTLSFALRGSEAREGMIGLTRDAEALRAALFKTDSERFLRALQSAGERLAEAVSQDILIELLFTLLSMPVEKHPIDEACGLLADLSIEMPGGKRQVVFIDSLTRAAECLTIMPGEQPALLIQCGA